jgi:16S rRNA (adenine1518-N6/adenine1519-N6)-dimethyltransferase
MVCSDAPATKEAPMTTPKILLQHYELQPKKSLGQNFLHDPNALEKIVALADLQPSDHVLEVGPGTGALTEYLAARAGRLTCIELDNRLEPILTDRLRTFQNVNILWEDVLNVDVSTQMPAGYVMVANLPYYITSAILRHVLEPEVRPRRLVLTVQLEVAERLIAKPNDMSLLTVSVQFFGKPRIAMRLNPAVFWPRPDVDSAVVVIDTHATPIVEVPSQEVFFSVVRAGFSQKRKQLKNAIGGGLGISTDEAATLIERAGVDPRRRAETLTLPEWAAIARAR